MINMVKITWFKGGLVTLTLNHEKKTLTSIIVTMSKNSNFNLDDLIILRRWCTNISNWFYDRKNNAQNKNKWGVI